MIKKTGKFRARHLRTVMRALVLGTALTVGAVGMIQAAPVVSADQNVAVTAAKKNGSIKGKITFKKKAVKNVSLIAFEVDKNGLQYSQYPSGKSIKSNKKGVYSIKNLPPGRYKLYVADGSFSQQYYNGTSKLKNAKIIRVKSGKKVTPNFKKYVPGTKIKVSIGKTKTTFTLKNALGKKLNGKISYVLRGVSNDGLAKLQNGTVKIKNGKGTLKFNSRNKEFDGYLIRAKYKGKKGQALASEAYGEVMHKR